MSITIVIVSTAVASSIVASLVTFLLKQAFDRQLEYHFNARLEQLKIDLVAQSELKQKFTERRLELYPRIVEAIYRTRNILREICQKSSASIEQNLVFIRLAKDYTELIYQARLDLERDNIFNVLHSYKDKLVTAENLSLDIIHLATRKLVKTAEIKKVMARLKVIYAQIERQHRRMIINLTKLTEA